MTLVLQPQNSFTIVRQIPNWMDSATNYVQAVIRNAYTDAIIATVQLTDKGGQRFKYDWQVPADPSGQGFYISIVTSVYTDNAYTTKNQNYGDDENTYLVQDRVIIGRVGGSSGPDAFEIKSMIQTEFKKFVEQYKAMEAAEDGDEDEPEEPPKWDEVLAAIKDVRSAIKPQKELDFSEIISKIESLGRLILKAIKDKPVTPQTDVSELVKQGQETSGKIDAIRTDHQKIVSSNVGDVVKTLSKTIPPLIENSISDSLDRAHFDLTLPKIPMKITTKGIEPKDAQPRDITKLGT